MGGGPGRPQGEEEGDAVLAAPLHRAAAVGEQPGGRAGVDGAVVAAVVAAAHRRGGSGRRRAGAVRYHNAGVV